MNETNVTVIGFLAAEPVYRITAGGVSFMSMRMGSAVRRYDRDAGIFRDETPSFLTVNCWRTLAENLSLCDLKRGDPIVVTGRLRVREYEKDGALRHSTEVEATTVGYDLSRGVAHFQRVTRSGAASIEDRQEANDLNDQWLAGIGQGSRREGEEETYGFGERGAADPKPESPKSENPRPGEANIGQAKPRDVSAGDAEHGATPDVPDAEAAVGRAMAGEGKPGDVKPGEVEAGDAKAGDAKVGDAKVGDAKAGDAKVGDAKAGDAKAGDAKVGEARGREARARGAKARDAATGGAGPAAREVA